MNFDVLTWSLQNSRNKVSSWSNVLSLSYTEGIGKWKRKERKRREKEERGKGREGKTPLHAIKSQGDAYMTLIHVKLPQAMCIWSSLLQKTESLSNWHPHLQKPALRYLPQLSPQNFTVYLVKEILQWEVWSLPPRSRSTSLDQHPAKSQRFHEALQHVLFLQAVKETFGPVCCIHSYKMAGLGEAIWVTEIICFLSSAFCCQKLFFFFLFYTCSHLIFSPIWYFYLQIKTLRLLSPAVLWKGREPSSLSGFGTCLQGISLWPASSEQGRCSQPLHVNPYSPPRLSAVCNDPGIPPHLILSLFLLLGETSFASFNSNKPKIFSQVTVIGWEVMFYVEPEKVWVRY